MYNEAVKAGRDSAEMEKKKEVLLNLAISKIEENRVVCHNHTVCI